MAIARKTSNRAFCTAKRSLGSERIACQLSGAANLFLLGWSNKLTGLLQSTGSGSLIACWSRIANDFGGNRRVGVVAREIYFLVSLRSYNN